MCINKFINSIKFGRVINIYGNGEQRRDFTYIDDVSIGNLLSMKRIGYQIINIGCGSDNTSIKKILKKISIMLNARLKVKYFEPNKSDVVVTLSSSSKSKMKIDWKSKVSIN